MSGIDMQKANPIELYCPMLSNKEMLLYEGKVWETDAIL